MNAFSFRAIGSALIFFLGPAAGIAWDYEGHRLVNQLAVATLPTNFPAFVQTPEARERIAFLTEQSHQHVIHYTPKHGSWLNQVEIWFSVLARRVIRRGDFPSKADLMRKILAYIEYDNAYKAHPYAWTYTGKPLVA